MENRLPIDHSSASARRLLEKMGERLANYLHDHPEGIGPDLAEAISHNQQVIKVLPAGTERFSTKRKAVLIADIPEDFLAGVAAGSNGIVTAFCVPNYHEDFHSITELLLEPFQEENENPTGLTVNIVLAGVPPLVYSSHELGGTPSLTSNQIYRYPERMTASGFRYITGELANPASRMNIETHFNDDTNRTLPQHLLMAAAGFPSPVHAYLPPARTG